MNNRTPKATVHDLTEEEERDGLRIPDSPSWPPGEEEKPDERVQVNLSKYVVEKLIKAWLDKGARSGTIKDICERAVRLWLTIFANVKKDTDVVRFNESQTGQDLRRLADRVDRDFGSTTSRSVKEAFIARIGAHLAVSLLRTPGVEDPTDDLFHELFTVAEKNKWRLGEEVVDRLRLAAKAFAASPETPVRELLEAHSKDH